MTAWKSRFNDVDIEEVKGANGSESNGSKDQSSGDRGDEAPPVMGSGLVFLIKEFLLLCADAAESVVEMS